MERKGRRRGREGMGGEGVGGREKGGGGGEGGDGGGGGGRRGRRGGKKLTWLKEISFRVSGPFSILRWRGSRTVNMPATLCSPKYSLCVCRCGGVGAGMEVCRCRRGGVEVWRCV